MKDPKKTGGSKAAAPAPVRGRPAEGASKTAQGASKTADPRSVPPPTAPPSVSAGALKSLAAIAESATTEPKNAAKPPPRAEAAKPPTSAGPASVKGAAKPADRPAPRPSEAKPAASSAGPKPAGQKPADDKPAGNKPAPVGAKPAPPSSAPTPPKGGPTPAPAGPKPSNAVPFRVVENPASVTSAVSAAALAAVEGVGARAPAQPPEPPPAAPTGDAPAPNLVDPAGWAELNGKMLNLMRSQTEANFALWRSTLGAGSLSEAIRIQTTGIREAYETTAAQWRDIAETAARLMGAPGGAMKLPWKDQDR